MIFFLLTSIVLTGIIPVRSYSSVKYSENVKLAGNKLSLSTSEVAVVFDGLNTWFPDIWKISNNSDRLVALSPDNTACVLMKTIDLKALDPNLPDFPRLGEKFVQEFKSTQKLTLLKPINVPLTFWASKDVPFDWKKLAATTNVPFDWKSLSFVPDKSTIRQSEQSQIKLITIEGVGKLGASERWASITLVGLPNGRVLLLFSVSGLEKAVVDANKQVFGKILRSLKPE
ncbi:MAG: hypothetical protein Q7U86_00310 [Draconibacterium sp.]|nr:hypothetical protein [Draconibacterium sp.]